MTSRIGLRASRSTLALLGAALICASVAVPADEPVPILPESLTWFSPPGNGMLKGAWIVGSEQEAGPYLLRVKLLKGGKIPPHTHPDERSSTVLSGTLYVGFGTVPDEAAMVAIPAGGVYVAPANIAHYLWAAESDVVYQESGVGPTGMLPARNRGEP